MKYGIGIQLYSVRDEMAKDFFGTIKKLAKIGYSEIEFAGYGGYETKTVRSEMNGMKIKTVATHLSLNDFENNIEKIISDSKILGFRFAVLSYAAMDTVDDCARIGKVLSEAAKKLARYDIMVCYHNHNAEFELLDGKYKIAHLLDACTENIFLELDLYWAYYAKIDMMAFIKQFSGKIRLFHIKDSTKDFKAAEAGCGEIDFADILATWQSITGKDIIAIVEQEEFFMDPFKSLAISFNNIKEIVGKIEKT
ncbi:MAG: sugar phosphate isomerase/epimerase family protein [Saccharofermentanales bacterium]